MEAKRKGQELSRGAAGTKDSLLARLGSTLAELGAMLLDLKRRNGAAPASTPIEKWAMVTSSQPAYFLASELLLSMFGVAGVAHLCHQEYAEEEGWRLKNTSLDGHAAAARHLAQRLRTFVDPGDRSMPVVLLRVGERREDESYGLTLTNCTKMVVMEPVTSEMALQQVLGRLQARTDQGDKCGVPGATQHDARGHAHKVRAAPVGQDHRAA